MAEDVTAHNNGAYRFPGNALLTDLDAAAKASASSGPFSLEPILFGKWRD